MSAGCSAGCFVNGSDLGYGAGLKFDVWVDTAIYCRAFAHAFNSGRVVMRMKRMRPISNAVAKMSGVLMSELNGFGTASEWKATRPAIVRY